MLKRHPSVSILALAILSLPLAAQKQDSPTIQQKAQFYSGSAWSEFLDSVGGDWRVEWCAATGTPKAIWGSGIALTDWHKNTLEEARREAVQLLHDRADLLKLGDSEFREIIGARMGRTWSFVFDQYYRGLQVIGGRADVRVNMVGRVPMFGSRAWQIPANFVTTPAIAEEVATAIAWQAMGQSPTGVSQPTAPKAPRLVIWGDVESAAATTCQLAWEVAVSNVDAAGNGPIGHYYVDATNGAVLTYVSDKHECGIPGCTVNHAKAALPVLTTVTVMGWTNVGIDAFDALTNVPLPGIVLNVPGIGLVTTNNSGQFTINIGAAVNIAVGAFDGRHYSPIVGSNAPSGNFIVNPGVNSTIQLLTAGASTPQSAHTNTALWIDRANEWVRTIVGNSAEMNTADNVTPTVNINNVCNAYYTGNTINFYLAGGGCTNTANATVEVHEWGHGIDDRYGGISNSSFEGLSEGWGDIFGMYLVDSPNLGSGFQTQNVPLRSGNNNTQYHTVSEVHSAGESWMGFAWNLRDHLAATLANRPAAIALTDTIVIGSIVANATDQPGAVTEVFIADDDDGNLANGTPHSADLIWACNQHSLPYPGSGGGGIPTNDDCAAAIAVSNGINGPYSNINATTSSPGWICASGANDVWFTYTAYQNGTLTVQTCGQASWDTALQIFSGTCGSLTSLACNDDACSVQSLVTVPVTPGVYYIRVGGYTGATGTFNLDVNGPSFTPAASTPFGVGCYSKSQAFYELQTGAAMDLNGLAMTLIKTGNHYLAVPGGAYNPPSGGATQLVLGDDTEVTVPLAGTLNYPDGSTTALTVCSNGFVSAASGNGTAWVPDPAAWAGSSQARWGSWHDFNPTALGSGQVKFEQIGSVAYVTWQGVYSYLTTDANTFQLQFNLSNGNVAFVYQSVVASGGNWLTGFASPAPNEDLGSIDITASLPATFATSDGNSLPLALTTTLPSLGSTLTQTTTQFPPSSLLGIQLLSPTMFNPGINLSVIGMPNCFLYSDLTSLELLFPVAGQATHTLPVPNNPSLMGAQLATQSAAFDATANAFGLVTSNGVALTIGV